MAIDRYGRYAKLAHQKGWIYLYITKDEGYAPYREGIIKAVGMENAFFLNIPGEWNRFVRRVKKLLEQ